MNLEKILKEYQLLSPYYYDNLFKSSVRDNGERIYLDKRVRIIEQTKSNYIMETEDSSTYDINIIFDSKEENEILDASCSCDKFMNSGFMCEHIYALLQKLKYEKPRKQVISIVDYWQKRKIKFRTLCREFYLDNQNAINKLNPFSFQYMFDYKNKVEELEELNTQTYLCLVNKLSIQKNSFISARSILEEMLVLVNDNIILKIMLEQKIKDLIKIHYNYEMELEDYESHFK